MNERKALGVGLDASSSQSRADVICLAMVGRCWLTLSNSYLKAPAVKRLKLEYNKLLSILL